MPISETLLTIANIIYPALPGLLGCAIVALVIELQKRRLPPKRKGTMAIVPVRHSKVFGQTHKIKQLERRLSGLLHGDKQAVHRILSNLRKTYPKQSVLWLYEKAIWDIERDRF